MKRYWIICIVLFGYFLPNVNAQTITLTGTLKQKPWTKSTESYCAQGSEYFVLSRPNQEDLVLEWISAPNLQWINQRVQVRGVRKTKSIPKPSDNVQRPVSFSLDGKEEADFECTVFEVRRLTKVRR